MTKRRTIESFAPTGGRILGVITILIALIVLVDIVLQWRTWDGLTAAGVVIALGALVWMSMIRPAVVAYEDTLVIRNLLRDVWIPWYQVSSTEIRPILIIHTTDQGSHRSVAVAVTRADRRAMWRSKEDAARRRDKSGSAPTPASRSHEQAARLSPAMHASHRIDVMAEKYAESAPQGDVRKTWAVPELAVFGVGVLAAVIGYLAS